jgi:hypothetical protein
MRTVPTLSQPSPHSFGPGEHSLEHMRGRSGSCAAWTNATVCTGGAGWTGWTTGWATAGGSDMPL